MWDCIQATGQWSGEIWNRRKNGEVYPDYLTITAVKDKHGTVTHYVGTHLDITLRKAAADEIERLRREAETDNHNLTHLGEANAILRTRVEFLLGVLDAREALLREIYSYAEDQGMETLMDMIDAADSASAAPAVHRCQPFKDIE